MLNPSTTLATENAAEITIQARMGRKGRKARRSWM
jgi:hypothetical protein